MKISIQLIFLCLTLIFISGCSTTGNFKIPTGTELFIYDRPEPVQVEDDGKVSTTPFFWTALGVPPRGGIKYRLEKDGKEIKKGRLRTRFRIVSLFWPPFAEVYWPFGFNPYITYDLMNDKQE